MIDIPGLKISGPLGKGGTASVAKAFSENLKREVAVKYPLAIDNFQIGQFNKLAEREIKLVGNINFPGIVRVMDHSASPPYLLLELCSGQTLDKLGKVEDVILLLNILSSIAASMEFLKLCKIVHGDFKPNNIFLPSDISLLQNGKMSFTKISDFGLGRTVDEPESSRAGHGTIGYAAPETMLKQKTSHKSDLFALGIIAYEMATGQHPFMGSETDPVQIESNIQEKTPESITGFRNDLPEKFTELVVALLSKEEDNRPECGWNVCQKLREAGAGFHFEKILSPHFLIKNQNSYSGFLDNYLSLSEREKGYLEGITDSKIEYLRLVLASNFRKGNLVYSGSKYEFIRNIYWPSALRRKSLCYFSTSLLRTKKEIILGGVIGKKVAEDEINGSRGISPPGSSALFQQLISTQTVKRFSRTLAPKFESRNEFFTSTMLYLQAGMLEEACSSGEKAFQELADETQRTAAIHLVNRISEYAISIGREFEVRQLYMIKGDIERTGGDTDSAAVTYNKLIELYDNHKPDNLLAETYRDVGDLFKIKQRFEEGLSHLNKALKIYRELNNELEESRTLNAIGEIYRIDTNLPAALSHMRQALKIQKRLHAKADAANSLNNIAIIFGIKGKLSRAITILSIALKMKRQLPNQLEVARTLNNLGYANYLIGNMTEAVKFLREALIINRKLGTKKEILNNLWNLSEVLLKSGSLQDALRYLNEGLQLARSLADKPHIARFHLSMANVFMRMGRFHEAAVSFDKVDEICNEIDDEILKLNLDINRAELRYHVGDLEDSKALAKSALSRSEKLKTEQEQLEALSILVLVTGDKSTLQKAKGLTHKNNVSKESAILDMNYLSHKLNKIETVELLDVSFKELEQKEKKFNNDIDYSRWLNVVAESHLLNQDLDKASSLLKRSVSNSRSNGLALDELDATILKGQSFYLAGDFEQAYSDYKSALNLCKMIAQNTGSEDDKKFFMGKPKVRLLAEQIKILSQKFGIKQKAGV